MTNRIQGVARDDFVLSEKIKAELLIEKDDISIEKVIAENLEPKDKDAKGSSGDDSEDSGLSLE